MKLFKNLRKRGEPKVLFTPFRVLLSSMAFLISIIHSEEAHAVALRLFQKSRRVAKGLALPATAALVGLVLSMALASSAHAGWYNSNWQYRKLLTIDYTKVSSATQTNFPVLVSLSSDSDLAARARTDGYDILFTLSDGTTKVDHEIEKYTNTTGALIAWVRIPSLSNTADTNIYMYYGYASAPNQQNPTGVWDTNYQGVWHLSNNNFNDSTSHANNGTNNGSTNATGEIGDARYFGTAQYIDCGAFTNITNEMTAEFWINITADIPANQWPQVVGKGNENTNGWRGYVNGGSHLVQFAYRGTASHWDIQYTPPDMNTWYHFVVTFSVSGNVENMYANGSQVSTYTPVEAIVTNTNNFQIGEPANQLNSYIDEVRISNTARSAGWIQTSYNNQSNQGTGTGKFIKTLGSQETQPAGSCSFAFRKSITVNSGQVSGGPLTNFPMLVNITGDPNLKTTANGGHVTSSSGYDIIFRGLDDTTCGGAGTSPCTFDHEIEKYDGSATGGTLVAWVRIPSINNNTGIYMYYGNSCTTSSMANPTGVWDANYKGVWHLKEVTGSNLTDSTSNGHTGTQNNSPTQTAGQIDGSLTFNGTNQYVQTTSNESQTENSLTWECWFKAGNTTSLQHLLWEGINTGNGWGETASYVQEMHISVGNYCGGSILNTLSFFLGDRDSCAAPGGPIQISTGAAGSFTDTTSWHHVVATASLSSSPPSGILYLDGASVGTANGTTTRTQRNTWNTNFRIGVSGVLTRYYAGNLDEVRISNVARSANWITTEYNNQKPSSTFYAVGGEQSGYQYQKKITIDRTKLGSCSGDVTNFPVLISIQNDPNLKTTTNGGHVYSSSGYDIAFRAFDGTTQLDHEIETYDGSATGGTLVAWVRIPTLSVSADTVIYMNYGNGSITSPTANPTGVWDSNYMGVWHLSNNSFLDSTSNANNGTNNGTTDIAGQMGNARYFNGSAYISATSNASLTLTTEMTLEAWVYLPSPSANQKIVGRTTNGTLFGYELGSGDAQPGMYPEVWDTNGTSYTFKSGSISASTWAHEVLTWKTGGRMKGYVNASQVADIAASASSIGAGNLNLIIGAAAWDPTQWRVTGRIDEVRVSDKERDACWIGTEYNNQLYPNKAQDAVNGFLTVDAEGAGPALPTAVKLASLTAMEYSGGVLLRWKTGYEVDNLGFHVYREENGQLIRLTPEPVAGSALLAGSRTALTAGYHYHWWDAGVNSQSSSIRYWLKDIDLNGTETMHGPVTPVFSKEPIPNKFRPELLSEVGLRLQERYQHYWKVQDLRERLGEKRPGISHRRSALSPEDSSLKTQSSVLSTRHSRLSPRSSSLDTTMQQYLASSLALKLLVTEEGWYRVTQPELVAAGLDPGVNPRYLQLYVEGREQAIRVIGEKNGRFGPQGAIEFYGTGIDTPSTDTRVYWLIWGLKPGKRVDEYRGLGGQVSSSSFPCTVERKERTIYFPDLRNGDEDNFFGSVVYQTRVDELLEVKHLDPGSSGDGLLEVVLQGATNVSHRVKVLLNNEEVGQVVFEGQSKGLLQLEVSQSLLLEGGNLVSFVPLGGEMDVSFVDIIRLIYWHIYTADDNGLRFTGQGGNALTLDGFSNPGIRVFDITDSVGVLEVVGRVNLQKGGYDITFKVPGTEQPNLLALTDGQVKEIAGMVPNQPSSWSQSKEGYDFVIIAHRDFVDSLQPLKSLRESQGLSVALVNLEDIYDEFNFGEKSPQAIKDFLTLAKSNWKRPLRFVLLVGDASFDPRNYLGMGYFDFMPTKLVETGYLETASDDWFVDLNNDGLPEMAIGRLPVRTVEEANTVVSKIIGYEKSGKKNEALLVADRTDNPKDFNFEGASEEVRALLPASITVRKIFRSNFSSDAQVKQELLSDINLGPLLLNFVGHGSVEIWRGDLLTSDDAEALVNGMRLPFFVNMTCLNGFFHDVYTESLAEALLRAKQGGAVAVWASSGLTEPDRQALMNKELIRLLFGRESLTLGEATARAKTSVSDQDIRKTWILFGDPTTRLK